MGVVDALAAFYTQARKIQLLQPEMQDISPLELLQDTMDGLGFLHLGHLGVQALSHLHPSMTNQDGPVCVDVDQGCTLQNQNKIKGSERDVN